MTDKKKTHIAEVVHHGKEIIIPHGMKYDDAIDILHRKQKYESEIVHLSYEVDAFVWDGALAFYKAMKQLFGFAMGEAIPSKLIFAEDEKPTEIKVQTSADSYTMVPWGRFSLPGINGYVETISISKNGRVIFCIFSETKRIHKPAIKELAELTEKLAKEESIYKSKAFKVDLSKNMPIPQFLDLRKVKEDELILSDDIMSAVETNLFTPIEHTVECREYGIPLKRGVLLSGPYGTGKTLSAYVAAKKCERNGWTFLYCSDAHQLGDMIDFAKHYEPCVVFCEDIDRSVSGDRTSSMDYILNTIDGIEAKDREIMVILTTNHLEDIHKALLRPGRLDAVIPVEPPDAKAVEKLIRLYSGKALDEDIDLTEAGKTLEGNIPAVIRECVERSKLSSIKLGVSENGVKLTSEAILDSAKSMKKQIESLKESEVKPAIEQRFADSFKELMGTDGKLSSDLLSIKSMLEG